jgi:Rad3-related DNA helicase
MIYRSAEQAAYARLIEGALAPGAPLLAGAAAGLGKTHGYSIPLLRSGRRVAIAMSTRQLIEQYLSSAALTAARQGVDATVEALQPRQAFESDRAHREHRERALRAQVLVLTHAAALIDSLNPGYAGLRAREVVLFDEADLLADAADLRGTFVVGAKTFDDVAPGETDPRRAAERVKLHAREAEDRACAAAILHALAHPAWYKAVGWTEEGDLALKHRMPGRMLRPLLRELPRAIFTSGTLQVAGRFDHFVGSLGLPVVDPASRHIDPKAHGRLRVEVALKAMSDEQKVHRILQAPRPALVLTTSHADTQALGALLPGAVLRDGREPLQSAVDRCRDDGILVAAGAWSGLDEPRLRWKTVALPKAPYGAPLILAGRFISHYVDSRVVAVRRTDQGLHRGLRTPDAQCLLLLDPRSGRPELREAIPARFSVDWDDAVSALEGTPEWVAHFKRERTSLRNMALRHHGHRCQWPDCDVTALHLLDVHHAVPLAHGARTTTLDDLQVLCKNHHAEAHFRMRAEGFPEVESKVYASESMT